MTSERTDLGTFGKVREIVATQLGVDKQKVTLEANFTTDLGADSLDTVELVMAIEEEFDINIPDQDAESIATLGQAVKFIEKAVVDTNNK